MAEKTSYGQIFKSTALFGFVQVFNILTKVGINKVVAMLLGASGMGAISLYSSALHMIQTGAGLGISQSAVRDISEAHAKNDRKSFSRTISITNRIIVFTALLGIVVTIMLAPFLSRWSFGSNAHTIPFVILSIAAGAQIFSVGQCAILKGMRQLKALAKASMYGSFVGLLSAMPFYYLWGNDGIVPSLIVSSVAALIFSHLYVRRISYDKIKISYREIVNGASPMVKMGIALMFVNFLAQLTVLVVSSFIRAKGGLSDVGFYNAGMMIINGYFGVIITSLTTDYYPRIAAINNDNSKLQAELNQQSLVSLVICCPIIILFVMLMPLFVTILYTKEFLAIIGFMKIAMFGTIITIISNQIDMILIAKFQMKAFAIISIIYRVLQIILSMTLYTTYGLVGMGIALAILGVVHMAIMSTIVWKLYNIHLEKRFISIALGMLVLVAASVLVSEVPSFFLKYMVGIILLFGSMMFTYYVMKKDMGITLQNILNKIKSH